MFHTASFDVEEFVSVNVSAHQLDQPEFFAGVAEIVPQTGIQPDRLHLEITEAAAIAETVNLAPYRELGLRLAVDDFGTGFASLAMFRTVRPEMLKLDKLFIDGIERNAFDRAIVGHTIAMAHQLGIKVIAEGIETEAQARALRKLGCDAVQGFLYSPAVPSPRFRTFVTERGSG